MPRADRERYTQETHTLAGETITLGDTLIMENIETGETQPVTASLFSRSFITVDTADGQRPRFHVHNGQGLRGHGDGYKLHPSEDGLTRHHLAMKLRRMADNLDQTPHSDLEKITVKIAGLNLSISD